MRKKILLMLLFTAFSGMISIDVSAQNRKSVSATEVNGTFTYKYSGKFKKFSNEIKILALGKGRLKIALDLVYPYLMNNGEIMVNMGTAEGIAEIEADKAVFVVENEYSEDQCRIVITFVKSGVIEVTQEGVDSACGFGHRVSPVGKYTKTSQKKPVFGEQR